MEKVIEIHSKWPGPGLSRETPPQGRGPTPQPFPHPLILSHHQRRPQARVLRPGFQGECDEPVTLLSPPLTSRLPATTVSPALLCGVEELRFRGGEVPYPGSPTTGPDPHGSLCPRVWPLPLDQRTPLHQFGAPLAQRPALPLEGPGPGGCTQLGTSAPPTSWVCGMAQS